MGVRPNYFAGSEVDLREFALAFVRMVASQAVDPHGYFEKKYVARIQSACSEEEINGVLTQLVQWAANYGGYRCPAYKAGYATDSTGIARFYSAAAAFSAMS